MNENSDGRDGSGVLEALEEAEEYMDILDRNLDWVAERFESFQRADGVQSEMLKREAVVDCLIEHFPFLARRQTQDLIDIVDRHKEGKFCDMIEEINGKPQA